MKKKKHECPIFIGVDRLGLPLSDVVNYVTLKHKWTINEALLDFLLGAAIAGWEKKSARYHVREAIRELADPSVDARLLRWAKEET